MKVIKTDFDKIGIFSPLFLDYISQKASVSPFYNLPPSIEGFKKQIESNPFSEEKRKILSEALSDQYRGFEIKNFVKQNISSLSDQKTFTVTTGHQLNLFSGPLYFIYKIITVINVCKKLKEIHKEYNFVPVYWMASEDHDAEEINHFYLFNKLYTWNTAQKGAVGRFHTEGMSDIFAQIREKLPLFEKAYLEHTTLAHATRYFVNELFGNEGLIVIDADDKELKKEFKEFIKDELLNQFSYKEVSKTSEALKKSGYGLQVNPREINLFYMDEQLRERIERKDNSYVICNTDLTFSENEIIEFVDSHPEKFSPNVVLRPLYQQMVLPNISYCGGPAEISYWLQLKGVFDHYKVSFPLLLPRLSALIINTSTAVKLNKLGISPDEIFMSNELLKENMLKNISDNFYKLEEEEKKIEDAFGEIKNKAGKIDASLESFVSSEKQKVIKLIEGIEKKLKKAEESKNEGSISQLINIKSKLFPDGQLQERRDNFLNFFINDSSFLIKLLKLTDPFDYRFNIIIEDE
jgi:bacillithiol synthase